MGDRCEKCGNKIKYSSEFIPYHSCNKLNEFVEDPIAHKYSEIFKRKVRKQLKGD